MNQEIIGAFRIVTGSIMYIADERLPIGIYRIIFTIPLKTNAEFKLAS